MKLSKFQIDLIRGDIRQSGVEMRDLEDDLLDHVCCALEMEDNNSSFEELYHDIKKSTFPDGYREIQHTISYLLNLKYKKMKTTMNVFGITGSLMLFVGSILKFLSLIGANVMLVFGGAILVFGYLPFMLILSMKSTDTVMGKTRNISGYLGSALIIIGVVMSILHYYSGPQFFLLGIGIFLLIFLPLFIRSVGKDFIMKIHPITSAVIILAVLSTLFAFNNKKTSYTYRNALAEINNNTSRIYESKRGRLVELRKNNKSEISLKSEEALSYMNGLKRQLLGIYGLENESLNLEGWDVILDNKRFDSFMVENSGEFKYTGESLYEKVEAFDKAIKREFPEIKSSLLTTDNRANWIDSNFKDKPLIRVYSYLSQLQLEIADLEMEALKK